MGLDMFLQILRALESFATKVALVRLERNMDTDVRGDVVAFNGGSVALAPCTGQIEVVSRLAANMAFADMLLMSRQ